MGACFQKGTRGEHAYDFSACDVQAMKGGDTADWGGLFGSSPVMEVNQFDSSRFIQRGGRIPAPVHSFKN